MSVAASIAPRGAAIEIRAPARTGRTIAAVAMAVSAYAGALGLIAGFLDLDAGLNERLPFHSPVVGGLALAAIVGVPFTAVATGAWRQSPQTDRRTFYAGYVLAGWI